MSEAAGTTDAAWYVNDFKVTKYNGSSWDDVKPGVGYTTSVSGDTVVINLSASGAGKYRIATTATIANIVDVAGNKVAPYTTVTTLDLN